MAPLLLLENSAGLEFDASRRAKVILAKSGMITRDVEVEGVNRVLNAAALTYVAAFATSLMTLMYWAMQLGLLGGRRD